MRLAHGPIDGWSLDGRSGVLAGIEINKTNLAVCVQLDDGETVAFVMSAHAVDPLVWTILKSIRDERSAA